MFMENFLDFLKNSIGLHLRVNIIVLVQLRVVLDDFSCLILISYESFFDALDVVITPSTAFSSLQQSVGHYLLTTFQVQNERNIYLFIHQLFPS